MKVCLNRTGQWGKYRFEEKKIRMGRKTKKCVLGNEISRDHNSKDLFASSQCIDKGIYCKRCGCFSCAKCVEKILSVLRSDSLTASGRDTIIMNAESCLTTGKKMEKCHACWMSEAMKSSARNIPNYKKLCSSEMMGDGYLVFEQFGIGIDAPMASDGVVDVHGLGEDVENGLPAVCHFVVSAASAVNIKKS